MIFWSAFLLGITGSFHCLGMCAPLMWLIPHGGRGTLFFVLTRFLYQFGRILTYAIFGAAAGFFGQGLVFQPLQSVFLLFLGIFLLFAAVFSFNPDNITAKIPFLNGLSFRLSAFLGKYLKNKSNFFIAGVLNAFLPCGLVYTALLGAVGSGDWANGTLYMFIFGSGTFPFLFLISLTGKPLSERFKEIFRRFYPLVLLGTAAIFLHTAWVSFAAYQNSLSPSCH